MSTALDTLLDQLADQIAERVAEQLRHELLDRNHDQHTPWLSLDTAAAYLDWPKQRLYKLTAQGAIPHYKHDGRLLFNRSEIDSWLRQYSQPERPLADTREQSYS
jgi:excisionase family DNA binding protein